jgi:hypothetical protein
LPVLRETAKKREGSEIQATSSVTSWSFPEKFVDSQRSFPSLAPTATSFQPEVPRKIWRMARSPVKWARPPA